MKTHKLPLLRKELIADDTYAFWFPKPADFTYTAGQYVSLCVDVPEVAMPGGTMRELSLASAPYEQELLLALRFRESRAKQQFRTLTPGDTAYIQGPFGQFGLEKGTNPVVFLAGGIGIVPFLGMIKQALHEKQTREMYLFFSNRRRSDIPFLHTLEELSGQTPNFTVIQTLTAEKQTDWKHETGYLTPTMLRTSIPNLPDASFYISGPQRFVGGMWELLGEMAIPDTAIHGEEFTGY